jgi:CubicO group peptidase (beta-lactamase class C family)
VDHPPPHPDPPRRHPDHPGQKVDAELLTDWERIVGILCDAKPVLAPGGASPTTRSPAATSSARWCDGDRPRHPARPARGPPRPARHPRPRLRRPALGGRRRRPQRHHRPAGPWPLSWLVNRALGLPVDEATTLSNDPRFLTSIIPAGNIIGTADEACRFYQMLLGEGQLDGVRVLEPRTVRRAVAETSYLEVDLTLLLPVRYGMGFMLGGDRISIYGDHTPRAYGHVGFTNVITWCDPERDLAAALMTSGKSFVHAGLLRWLNVMRVVARECPREPRGRS